VPKINNKPRESDPTLLNREEWLKRLAARVEPLFHGMKLAPYRLACGWPCRNAVGGKVLRLGECHALESSKAGVHEIFITPLIDDPQQVAGVTTHELAHVAAGIKAGHGRAYAKVCRHVGLTEGKPSQAAPGPRLADKLAALVAALGPYPHAAIVPSRRAVKARKGPVTLTCVACTCPVRMAAGWVAKAGNPTCGCGGEMVALEGISDDDE
jgi:hypothetical protein